MSLIDSYLPILILAVIAGIFAVGTIILSLLFGTRKPSPKKLDAYECGMPPIGHPHERFSVKFFLVAMLFVIFDIEVVFLYPWATIFRRLGVFGMVEMGIFLAVLILGLVYVWKTGVLEWGPETRARKPLAQKETP